MGKPIVKRMRIGLVMATALMMLLGPGIARAQESQGAPVSSEVANTAFNKLFSSAETRLMNAGARLEAVRREVVGELEAFAKEYPGTAAAAVSLQNAGNLAEALREPDRAEALYRESLLHRPPSDLYGQIAGQLSNVIAKPGRLVRDYTAVTLDEEEVSPASLKGKVVLLDFWATWCGPCIGELPHLQQAYKEHHDAGFEIVSISLDSKKEDVTGFFRENEMPWKQVFDEDRPMEQRLGERFGVYSIPHTILVGRDGKIVARDLRGPALGEAVKKALGE